MSNKLNDKLDSEDYFQLTQCLSHCIDDLMKLRFVSTTEWERLTILREKCERASVAARREEGKDR